MIPKGSRADTSYFISPWFGCNFVIDGLRSISKVETAMATWDEGSLHNVIGSFVNSQESSPNCTTRWLPLTDIRAKKNILCLRIVLAYSKAMATHRLAQTQESKQGI